MRQEGVPLCSASFWYTVLCRCIGDGQIGEESYKLVHLWFQCVCVLLHAVATHVVASLCSDSTFDCFNISIDQLDDHRWKLAIVLPVDAVEV